MGHLLTENRNGLIVDTELAPAGTRHEWDAETTMLAGAEFVDGCRGLKITPHLAAKASGGVVDGRTTLTQGYAISQIKRKRIEECFGWMKDIGLMRKLRHIGRAKVAWQFRFTAAAYNITRLKELLA